MVLEYGCLAMAAAIIFMRRIPQSHAANAQPRK
jgi:hypothetical protein